MQSHHHMYAAKTAYIHCIQAWSPYLRKDIYYMLEKIQRRATKLIPGLRDLTLTYEERLKECGLTTLVKRQIEVFKILNGYENIDSNIFFPKLRKVK